MSLCGQFTEKTQSPIRVDTDDTWLWYWYQSQCSSFTFVNFCSTLSDTWNSDFCHTLPVHLWQMTPLWPSIAPVGIQLGTAVSELVESSKLANFIFCFFVYD